MGHFTKKENLWAYYIEPVAAGAHLLTPWLFELEKCDRADYYLDFTRINAFYNPVLEFQHQDKAGIVLCCIYGK